MLLSLWILGHCQYKMRGSAMLDQLSPKVSKLPARLPQGFHEHLAASPGREGRTSSDKKRIGDPNSGEGGRPTSAGWLTNAPDPPDPVSPSVPVCGNPGSSLLGQHLSENSSEISPPIFASSMWHRISCNSACSICRRRGSKGA